jgi:hypothetical protein
MKNKLKCCIFGQTPQHGSAQLIRNHMPMPEFLSLQLGFPGGRQERSRGSDAWEVPLLESGFGKSLGRKTPNLEFEAAFTALAVGFVH